MKHNWEYKRLGDVCTLKVGGDKPSDISEIRKTDKNIPIYSNGIENEGLYGYCNCPTILEPAVTISGRGTLGVPFIRKEPFVPIVRLIVAIPNELLSLEYLYYWVLHRKFSGNGVAVPQLTVPMIKNEAIPIPPNEIQEQIVAELDKINEVIADCRELLRKLDVLAKSLFYDYFGDPVTNSRGWNTLPLKELSTLITNGTTPKGGQAVYVDSGLMFFRSQNVWRNHIIYDDIVYLDESTNASMKGSMLKHNDILITKTGRINTENSSLGRSALFTGEDDTANINGHVYLVRLDGSIEPRFVLSILLTDSYRDLIRKVCVGAIDKRQLNLTHIQQFPIILPPLELQRKYVRSIEAIERQKVIIEETIKKMQTLLDSRMDYWFN